MFKTFAVDEPYQSIFLNVLSRVKGVFDSISLMASEIMRRMTHQSKRLKKQRKLS